MLDAAFWSTFGSSSMCQAISRSLAALPRRPERIAVALSGGADSAMLAVHAAIVARREGYELHCFHVHHGLQAHADAWQDHAHQLARLLNVPSHTRCVQIDARKEKGDGIESAARDARYAAFAELAAHARLDHILLAHHLSDQAETVLLRLLRGAGPTGLAAMAPYSERLGIGYLRPWLDIERADILLEAEAFARLSGWAPVQDPTNRDARYARAAVRERLAPELNARWPGWRETLARHARQSGELRDILEEVAADDFARLSPSPDGKSFSLAQWRDLAPGRQALVLRYWLAQCGLRMPTDARLRELMRQMRDLHALGHDRNMRVRHGQASIVCVRGRVFIE